VAPQPQLPLDYLNGRVIPSGARDPCSGPHGSLAALGMTPGLLQDLDQLPVERLRRLVGHPVAGAGDDMHPEVRLQCREEIDALLDVRVGRRIELAPDAGE